VSARLEKSNYNKDGSARLLQGKEEDTDLNVRRGTDSPQKKIDKRESVLAPLELGDKVIDVE